MSASVREDLAVVVKYLSSQWLPEEVRQAMRRISLARRVDIGETGLGPGLVMRADGRYLDLDAREGDGA